MNSQMEGCAQGKASGKGCGEPRPFPETTLSLHLRVFANSKTLQTLSSWDFMNASLHRYGRLKKTNKKKKNRKTEEEIFMK